MNIHEVIYLDNNSTTQCDQRVLEAMLPFFLEFYANPNSKHSFAKKPYEAVKRARSLVAELIGAESSEIIFTSGATESINLAIKGYAELHPTKKHIITVSTEHKAVLDTCAYLGKKGYDITYLPVQKNGILDLEHLRQAFRDDTLLVSVMYVNNETGVIQPIKEIAKITHDAGSIFMCDATQAVGKIPINVDQDDIDLMALSAHKFYGPKGVGALYCRNRKRHIRVEPIIHGGGHERGMRSGTLNVPGIIGLGKAAEIAMLEMGENKKIISKIRNYTEQELMKIEGVTINGDKEKRIHTTTNVTIRNVDADALILTLGDIDIVEPIITLSSGSACTSHSIDPSHVLLAMGMCEEDIFSSIRISYSHILKKQSVYSHFAEHLRDIIYHLSNYNKQ
jgi:cysteine desulfurase